jgi:hypothetical protein
MCSISISVASGIAALITRSALKPIPSLLLQPA